MPGDETPAPPSPPAAPLVVEGEVLDPHELRLVSIDGTVVGVRCACGRWDAIVTGPSSARWAAADHRRHIDRGTVK
jgi:hypothetical protein